MTWLLFVPSEDNKHYYTSWDCQKVFEPLSILLDNIIILMVIRLYKERVGILMETELCSLATNLFLFCYERYAELSRSSWQSSHCYDSIKFSIPVSRELIKYW